MGFKKKLINVAVSSLCIQQSMDNRLLRDTEMSEITLDLNGMYTGSEHTGEEPIDHATYIQGIEEFLKSMPSNEVSETEKDNEPTFSWYRQAPVQVAANPIKIVVVEA